MSFDDPVIRVNKLSKCYQIYDKPQDRLKQAIMPRLWRLTGKTEQPYYREFWALNNVSFEVRRGETMGVIGRNGSGKSTLLQILCGILTPSSGSVEIAGRVAALLELGSGFNPEFTGRENVFLNASVLGLTDEEIRARFDDIVEFSEVGEFIDQPVKTYSSGMYVRLAFAVIAHVDADVLIIDEALSVGDVFFVQKCMRFLRKFMERGTVLFVSHDSAAVINLCHTALWLSHGEVVSHGEPKAVSEKYLENLARSAIGIDHQPGSRSVQPAATLQQVRRGIPRDMRQDFLNSSSLRNDIQIFAFVEDAHSFGAGGATITGVCLTDRNAQPLNWVVGGEDVCLIISGVAHQGIIGAIAGFHLKDRLGQVLFGDNTFLRYLDTPVRLHGGQCFEARFAFRMPILPAGDYTVGVAFAEGSQAQHVQHHWIHDALAVHSISSSVATGLIGIPMEEIVLEVSACAVSGLPGKDDEYSVHAAGNGEGK